MFIIALYLILIKIFEVKNDKLICINFIKYCSFNAKN